MTRKEFDVEFVVRGRFAIDTAKIREICEKSAARSFNEKGQAAPELGKKWLESPCGLNFQAAVVDTILLNQQLLTGFLLDKGAFLAAEILGDKSPSGAIIGRPRESEFIDLLVDTLEPPHREVLKELVDDDCEIDANLPALFEDAGSAERWGCFEVSKPFKVVVAAVSENK